MPKFRKKPVVIDAEQFIGDSHWPEGVEAHPQPHNGTDPLCKPHVKTLEGPMFVSEGDWIITGEVGEKYPCKDSIFQVTYEAVD